MLLETSQRGLLSVPYLTFMNEIIVFISAYHT